MACNDLTREELIERFATDWGRSKNITEKYSTVLLRAACNTQRPFDCIGNFEFFINKGLIDIDELNKKS